MKDVLEQLYAEISVGAGGESFEARVKGAKAALSGLNPGHAFTLAILAHRVKANVPGIDWLVERMERNGEPLNRAHTQEIGILSSAILLKSWQGEPTRAASVGALAVRNGAFMDWKARVAKLPAAADAYLARASLAVRRIGEVESEEGGLTSTADEAFPDGGQYPPERMRELHQELGTLREDLNAALEELSQAQRALSEQSSILWWLFGGRLIDGRRWAEAKEASRPLEFARDLHELSRFVPGPSGVRHFLADAMARSEMDPQRELTISGAMGQVAEGSKLRGLSVVGASSLLVLPVLCSVLHVQYPARARPGSLRRSALDIAEQLYRELTISEILSSGR
jgi:hypothetical protein